METQCKIKELHDGDKFKVGIRATVHTVLRIDRAVARGYYVVTLDGTNIGDSRSGRYPAHGDDIVTKVS